MSDCDIFTGRVVQASYTEAELPEYAGNPMIEALPPIMDGDADILAALMNEISHGEMCRAASTGARRHMIQRFRQFWYPQPDTIQLERRISTLLRGGYIYRNPTDLEDWHDRLVHARERLSNPPKDEGLASPRADKTAAHSVGMTVVGLSGVGKSTSIKRVLSTYPQKIVHDVSDQKHPVVEQLVWLLATCPEDGGTPGLCRSILAAFDKVMGTRWVRYFTERASSAHAMRTAVVSMAHTHALGLLVIDEIQLLKSTRTGNARTTMGFLLALMNDLDIPVLLVGTPEAAGVLNTTLQNARRFVGNGYLMLDRLKYGDGEFAFRDFVETLWDRAYLRDMKPFEEMGEAGSVILDCLYRYTAGIQDLVVKMFLFGQEFAIDNGLESLTTEVFDHVYQKDFAPLHGPIERLHAGLPTDEAEWAGQVRGARRAGMTAEAMTMLVSQVTENGATGKPKAGRKGGRRSTKARPAISAEGMAAGLEDARQKVGAGVLGGSLLGPLGDVVR